MPRSREFDEEKTLEKAMWLFWEKGYAETSMRDLVVHTGVAHAGLYSAFGSKQQLYGTALNHYRTIIMDRFLSGMEAPEASLRAIPDFYHMMLDIIEAGKFTNGCLMVNTVIECSEKAHPEFTFSATVDKHLSRMKNAYENALSNAIHAGELDKNEDVDALSDYFITLFNGISVMARAQVAMNQISNTVYIGLKVIE